MTKHQPRRCVNISIVDDNLVEDDETFIVSLTTSSGDQVLIGEPNTTTIRILDNDGITYARTHSRTPNLLYLCTAVMTIGFSETCYATPNQVNTEVCLEIKNKVKVQRMADRYRIFLARNQRCSQDVFSFRNNDTTGSRACSRIAAFPDDVAVTGPCQNINLLQSCQVQNERRRQIATFQEPTVAKVCFSNCKLKCKLYYYVIKQTGSQG